MDLDITWLQNGYFPIVLLQKPLYNIVSLITWSTSMAPKDGVIIKLNWMTHWQDFIVFLKGI